MKNLQSYIKFSSLVNNNRFNQFMMLFPWPVSLFTFLKGKYLFYFIPCKQSEKGGRKFNQEKKHPPTSVLCQRFLSDSVCLLFNSTIEQVLCIPFAGQNRKLHKSCSKREPSSQSRAESVKKKLPRLSLFSEGMKSATQISPQLNLNIFSFFWEK